MPNLNSHSQEAQIRLSLAKLAQQMAEKAYSAPNSQILVKEFLASIKTLQEVKEVDSSFKIGGR